MEPGVRIVVLEHRSQKRLRLIKVILDGIEKSVRCGFSQERENF